jgi:hypothetical protein
MNAQLRPHDNVLAPHRHAGDPLVDADDPVSDNGGSAVRGPTAASLPAALMRRIPVRPDAYRRWLAVWDELRGDAGDLAAVAGRHGFSIRQVEFIRRAGQAHLLDSDLPPALRAASNGHRPTPRRRRHGENHQLTQADRPFRLR